MLTSRQHDMIREHAYQIAQTASTLRTSINAGQSARLQDDIIASVTAIAALMGMKVVDAEAAGVM